MEEYKNTIRACRHTKGKAKAHLELNLTKEVKDNKKGFLNHRIIECLVLERASKII